MTVRTAILTYVGLLALLALTVGSSLVPLGMANSWINLGVAVAKAALIGLVFMHLRHSGMLVSLTVVVLLFWVVLLFSLTFNDYLTR